LGRHWYEYCYQVLLARATALYVRSYEAREGEMGGDNTRPVVNQMKGHLYKQLIDLTFCLINRVSVCV